MRSIVSGGGTSELIDRLRSLGAPSKLVTHRVVPWEDDPWSKGGYAFFDPAFPAA